VTGDVCPLANARALLPRLLPLTDRKEKREAGREANLPSFLVGAAGFEPATPAV
jgi:hypothetical protein